MAHERVSRSNKSRNGCETCRKKRVKCDETKPACMRCASARVACEGYKKRELQWRTVEEATLAVKTKSRHDHLVADPYIGAWDRPAANRAHVRPIDGSIAAGRGYRLVTDMATDAEILELGNTSDGFPSSLAVVEDEGQAHQETDQDVHIIDSEINVPSLVPSSEWCREPFQGVNDESMLEMPPTWGVLDLTSIEPPNSWNVDVLNAETNAETTSTFQHSPVFQQVQRFPAIKNGHAAYPTYWSPDSGGSEGLRRLATAGTALRALGSASPVPFSQPRLDMCSPEMLVMRFDKQTCGILSVKDAPLENPWRTLVWPLTFNSQALSYAICSAAAIHGSYDTKSLRLQGVEDMTTSISHLKQELASMRLDCALATAVILATIEGWESPTTTGMQHLRGAKTIIRQIFKTIPSPAMLRNPTTADNMRLKYLCNAFIYLEVLATLTTKEPLDDLMVDVLAQNLKPPHESLEIDPHLGCAGCLFPLIGRLGRLVQSVRKSKRITLDLISRANELKEELQSVEVPQANMFKRSQDPYSEVQHSIQTAEAMRFASLLLLRQAVPEVPCDTAQALAREILVKLATVPTTSRATNLHIFPLLVASCEISDTEDRAWTQERWMALRSRLRIANVDYSWDIVQEVWRRRDSYRNANLRELHRWRASMGSVDMPVVDLAGQECDQILSQSALDVSSALAPGHRSDSGIGLVQPLRPEMDDMFQKGLATESTVRGSLHWLAVMEERDWEVFLG